MKRQSPLMISVFCIAVLLVGLSSRQASGFEPVELRAGNLVNAEITREAVEQMDLEKLLLEEKFEPDQDAEDAIQERSPESGKAFLILEVMLKEEKSIGKYDYNIQFPDSDDSYSCIGMAIGDEPFDPRLWEVKPEDAGIETVRLLYEIEAAEDEVELIMNPALGLTIRPERVSFTVEVVDSE